MKVPFVKMHGSGNDFVVLDAIAAHPLPDLNKPEITRFLCDRRFGIGCDQLLVLDKPARKDADYRMLIYNADASQVEMCGNGIRCVAKFLKDKGYLKDKSVRIETLGGLIVPELQTNGEVKVDMGEPILDGQRIPVDRNGQVLDFKLAVDQPEKEITITCVSMGNPHCVTYVDDLNACDFNRLGAYLTAHPFFPKGVNVEFVEIETKGRVKVKVWERGAGPTLACGTGACAIAVASVLTGKTERKVDVVLPGGTLHIQWDETTNHVFMTGPATTVFEGEIEL